MPSTSLWWPIDQHLVGSLLPCYHHNLSISTNHRNCLTRWTIHHPKMRMSCSFVFLQSPCLKSDIHFSTDSCVYATEVFCIQKQAGSTLCMLHAVINFSLYSDEDHGQITKDNFFSTNIHFDHCKHVAQCLLTRQPEDFKRLLID